uniref:HIG1 domain-containing protein n=1 Tax=Anopheles christyi TaxID=43041 RepID=A0A182K180_9DIPT
MVFSVTDEYKWSYKLMLNRYCAPNLCNRMSGKIPSLDETHSDKLARKARESPFMPIGIAGLVAVCAIGAYKYKHRGAMSTSVFLMQLRVAAQGTVVSALSIGLAYTMANECK